MAEEPEIETNELRESLHELQEEREERAADEKANAWTRYLALSTAALAVVAALAALKAGTLVNESVISKQEASISQAQASDQWAYYQAKGLKAAVASTSATLLVELGRPGAGASRLKADADRYKHDQDRIAADAKKLEQERDEKNRESERLFDEHERFARAVTLTQVAIALSAIAALTKRRYIWIISMLAGALGTALCIWSLVSPVTQKPAAEPLTESAAAMILVSPGPGHIAG